jgi:uncharacterized phage-associated protein
VDARGRRVTAIGFDDDRFREAVLYVAWRMRRDERFGRTKLAKTLFYADFDAYAGEGEALTGAKYEHWDFGPFPPVLYEVEKQLERAGQAELRGGGFAGDESKLVAMRAPDTPHLEDWHKQLLDLKMDELAAQPSWKVSDKSHEHPGWLATQDREEIPYEAALTPTKPSREVMELARHRFAARGGRSGA